MEDPFEESKNILEYYKRQEKKDVNNYRDAECCGNCIYSSPPDEDCNHYCCDLDGDCPPHGNYIEAEEIMFDMWKMTHATREDCVCDGFDNDWKNRL